MIITNDYTALRQQMIDLGFQEESFSGEFSANKNVNFIVNHLYTNISNDFNMNFSGVWMYGNSLLPNTATNTATYDFAATVVITLNSHQPPNRSINATLTTTPEYGQCYSVKYHVPYPVEEGLQELKQRRMARVYNKEYNGIRRALGYMEPNLATVTKDTLNDAETECLKTLRHNWNADDIPYYENTVIVQPENLEELLPIFVEKANEFDRYVKEFKIKGIGVRDDDDDNVKLVDSLATLIGCNADEFVSMFGMSSFGALQPYDGAIQLNEDGSMTEADKPEKLKACQNILNAFIRKDKIADNKCEDCCEDIMMAVSKNE